MRRGEQNLPHYSLIQRKQSSTFISDSKPLLSSPIQSLHRLAPHQKKGNAKQENDLKTCHHTQGVELLISEGKKLHSYKNEKKRSLGQKIRRIYKKDN